MEIPVVEKVLRLNDEMAALNRATLREAGVRTVNMMGSAGCGKTALLERTIREVGGEVTIGVLAGDLATSRDAERLSRHTPHVVQINTGGACHLEAHQVRRGIERLPLAELDLLFVENVGNLICPVGFDLGEDVKVGVMSVPEGHDKPAKHPGLVLRVGLVVLSKTDLLPHVPFDLEAFRRDLAGVREDLERIELSSLTGEGFEAWLAWVRRLLA